MGPVLVEERALVALSIVLVAMTTGNVKLKPKYSR